MEPTRLSATRRRLVSRSHQALRPATSSSTFWYRTTTPSPLALPLRELHRGRQLRSPALGLPEIWIPSSEFRGPLPIRLGPFCRLHKSWIPQQPASSYFKPT